MSAPRNITRREDSSPQQSSSLVGSYSSINSRSIPYSGNSRRLSTIRLGSPILTDQLDISPRGKNSYVNSSLSIAQPTGSGANSAAVSVHSTQINQQQQQQSGNHHVTHYPPSVLIDADNPSFQSDGKDLIQIQRETSQYFNDDLTKEGGDITHDIKSNKNKVGELKRVKSSSQLSIHSLNKNSTFAEFRRESTASGINVPGGFRREFIIQKRKNLAKLNSDELKQIPFLTKNFMEFLYIYGHFAGESFEDDFDPNSSSSTIEESAFFENDETTPLINGGGATIKKYEAKGTTSTLKAFLIMLKSFIGTGVIFLPKAFSNGGLSFSILMLMIFGVYSYYCYYILVLAKTATKVSSFGDIGYTLYGSWMKSLILFSLVLTQIGFACAYIIFTSENLAAFIKNVTSWDIPHLYIFILQALVFIPLSFIRNVAKLSLSSLLANFLIFLGLFIILVFTSSELITNGVHKPVELFINKKDFSLFIGTAIFAFEGIGLIIPIQDSMQKPEKFPLVLLLVIITITILMITIATIGYLAYGEDIQTAILLNLPQSNIFVNLVQFFYSLAILLSTPLQLFPAIGIIEKRIFPSNLKGKFNPKIKWLKNFFRFIFVVICINISWFGANDLDKFVSFVGCFACIPLVYMYPPLLHLQACVKSTDHKGKVVDVSLLIIGLFAMVYTSYQIIFG